MTIFAGNANFAVAGGLGSSAQVRMAIQSQATIFDVLANTAIAERMAIQSQATIFDILANSAVRERITLSHVAALTVATTLSAAASTGSRFIGGTFGISTGLKARGFLRSKLMLCCTPSTATSRLGKKATWNVHGVDVPGVTVTDFGNYFQLHMPAAMTPDAFYSEFSFTGTDDELWEGTAFTIPDDSWKRLITIAPQNIAPYRVAVGPSMRAVESQPEMIAAKGVADYDAFVGSNFYPYDGVGLFPAPATPVGVLPAVTESPLFPNFLLPSTADMRMYQRYSVFDPDDLPTGGTQGTMFCGYGYFDFPPFTAEIDLSMPSQRCAAEFTLIDFMGINRFLIPQDNSAIAYVAGAIEAARRLVDKTLMFPNPTPVFSAGAPFIAGVDHYIVGQPLLAV